MTANDSLSLLGSVMALSLLSVGGASAVIPEMRRLMVDRLSLISDAAFGASVALAQAAPGPSGLYVAILGYQAAGVTGAALTLVGFMLPTTTLALAAASWSGRHGHARAVQALKTGLMPISIGTAAATCWVLTVRTAGAGELFATTAAALIVWRTRIRLVWLVAAGALLGGLSGVS